MLPKVPLWPSSSVYSSVTDVQVTSLRAVFMRNGPEKHFCSQFSIRSINRLKSISVDGLLTWKLPVSCWMCLVAKTGIITKCVSWVDNLIIQYPKSCSLHHDIVGEHNSASWTVLKAPFLTLSTTAQREPLLDCIVTNQSLSKQCQGKHYNLEKITAVWCFLEEMCLLSLLSLPHMLPWRISIKASADCWLYSHGVTWQTLLVFKITMLVTFALIQQNRHW